MQVPTQPFPPLHLHPHPPTLPIPKCVRVIIVYCDFSTSRLFRYESLEWYAGACGRLFNGAHLFDMQQTAAGTTLNVSMAKIVISAAIR